jgi:hypothetical protein
MRSLQFFVSLIALSLPGIAAEAAEFSTGKNPMLFAQALKAPGTVETRILKRLP